MKQECPGFRISSNNAIRYYVRSFLSPSRPDHGFSIVIFLAILSLMVSSSSKTICGEVVWSPIDLLDKFLDGKPSNATRFRVHMQLIDSRA